MNQWTMQVNWQTKHLRACDIEHASSGVARPLATHIVSENALTMPAIQGRSIPSLRLNVIQTIRSLPRYNLTTFYVDAIPRRSFHLYVLCFFTTCYVTDSSNQPRCARASFPRLAHPTACKHTTASEPQQYTSHPLARIEALPGYLASLSRIVFVSVPPVRAHNKITMTGEAWLYLLAVLINAVNLFLQVFFTIMYSDLEW
jgi:hypothetical protein